VYGAEREFAAQCEGVAGHGHIAAAGIFRCDGDGGLCGHDECHPGRDGGASGSGTWAYGSNAGGNNMNEGSGVVAAHLYRTAGSDTSYTATVTASDGTNTASCDLAVSAYDPSGTNGFPGAATTCISSSGTPVAGSGGCPASAAVLKTSSVQTAISNAYGNGKRLLFKCGDTFSGDNGQSDNLTAVKWAIGAYGGCQDTQSGRPIFSNSGSNYIFQFSGSNGNGTLSDFDCEGNSSSIGGCIWADASGVMYQDTIYNAYSNGESVSFNWAQCSQCAAVQVVQTGMGPASTQIGSYFNFSGYAGYPYSGNVFNNVNYTAVIGSHFDGGTTYASTNAETVRISECAYCYLANNDFGNSGTGGYSQLKIHEENPYNTESTWVGQYTQYMEISDNYFFGNSSAFDLELTPQNSNNDERLRYIVAERNIFASTQALQEISISGVNITARDNAFIVPAIDYYAIQVFQRGIEPAPQHVEIYNNSFYSKTCNVGGGYCNGVIALSNDGQSGTTEPSNSYVKNNLVYFPAGATVVVNAGGGNSISNNTATFTNDPAWTNASGTMDKITDWKPTANYSGGTGVPVIDDALGVPWSPTWDLGAVHP
jgi:hypothetical protein